jgi:hypothetical protein
MRKELDIKEAFAKWGKPGEELDDGWVETFAEILRKEGQLVGKHEWCGNYEGENVVYSFRGEYISEDEVDICGPFKTFIEAARAVNFFHVTTATTRIWIAPELLLSLELPPPQGSPVTRAEGAPAPPLQEHVGDEPVHEHENAWAKERENLLARFTASGLKVTTAEPSTSPELVVTFHNHSSLTMADEGLPKSKRSDGD